MDDRHRGRNGRPPGAKYLGTPHPFGHSVTQCRIGWKELERLVGKLRSMHLAVTGAVEHLYHIQRALDQGGVGLGLDLESLSPGSCRLAEPPGANGSLAHAPGQDRTLRSHPYGVL